MRKPTADDFAAAQKLMAAVFERTTTNGLIATPVPPTASCSNTLEDAREIIRMTEEMVRRLRPRSDAYWQETARLVRDYFELLAGVYSDTLFQGFIAWVADSPGAIDQYENGDDMSRAALVESYLRVVR